MLCPQAVDTHLFNESRLGAHVADVLPHQEVLGCMRKKIDNYNRWIGGVDGKFIAANFLCLKLTSTQQTPQRTFQLARRPGVAKPGTGLHCRRSFSRTLSLPISLSNWVQPLKAHHCGPNPMSNLKH